MKLEKRGLSDKEKAYVTLYADKVAAYIIKRAKPLKTGSTGFWFYGGTARGMGLPNDEEAAYMGDALRKALKPHLKTLGIYLKSVWDDEDGGWGLCISKVPFAEERDAGLFVAMVKTLNELEKNNQLPKNLTSDLKGEGSPRLIAFGNKKRK